MKNGSLKTNNNKIDRKELNCENKTILGRIFGPSKLWDSEVDRLALILSICPEEFLKNLILSSY